MKNQKSLTTEEFYNLYLIMKQGGSEALLARGKMIEGSLSLVRLVLNKYKFVNQDNFDDLYQEGVVALINAVDTYDGGKVFTTYAITGIDWAIRRAYTLDSTIHVNEKAKRVIEYAKRIRSGDISFDELTPSLKKDFEILFRGKSIKEIIALDPKYTDLYYAKDSLSLEYKPETDIMISNLYVDEFNPDFSVLTEDEAIVVRLYFGFDGDPVSLNKIAEIFNKDRSWAKRLLPKALAKLKEAL